MSCYDPVNVLRSSGNWNITSLSGKEHELVEEAKRHSPDVVVMNLTDSHSQVNEGLTVGSCRINGLLFVDNFMLLESSLRRLQHPLDWFSVCATDTEWKSALNRLMYYVSLQIQGSVRCRWAAIHCNRWRSWSTLGWYLQVMEGGMRRLIHGLVNLMQNCWPRYSP